MIHLKLIFLLQQADEQNLSLSEKARLHLEKYSFPVEMMVALPNGTVVSWTGHIRKNWHGNLSPIISFPLSTIPIGFCLSRSTTSMPTSSWTKLPWSQRRKEPLSASLQASRTRPRPPTSAFWRRDWRKPRSTRLSNLHLRKKTEKPSNYCVAFFGCFLLFSHVGSWKYFCLFLSFVACYLFEFCYICIVSSISSVFPD